MNYKENDKVTIHSEEWYNENKQPNGFIIYKGDGNKVSTFSPGMVKFLGKTFTIGKVITGSSIYPDHYTFIEDGGSYKWTDEMIAGLADANAQTYTRDAAASNPAPKSTPKPEPKPETKPEPKPEQKPEPKPTLKPETKPEPKPEPKPTPKPEEVEERKDQHEGSEIPEISAFESFTLLLKPRNGAAFADCATQAFKIMAANTTFPSATFNFNGFEITVTRK